MAQRHERRSCAHTCIKSLLLRLLLLLLLAVMTVITMVPIITIKAFVFRSWLEALSWGSRSRGPFTALILLVVCNGNSYRHINGNRNSGK